MQWLYWTIAILIAALAGWWVYRADRDRHISMPWLTALLRGLVILLTLLLILAPVISITKNEVQKPVVVLLQDDSRSIAEALGKDAPNYNTAVRQLVDKLSSDHKVVLWGFGNTVRTDSIFNYDQQATDINAAISRAHDFFGSQNLGAVILATDGRFNQGANPLYEQLALHSPLYCVAIGDSTIAKDMRIARVYANKTVALNSQFEIRADIVGIQCKGYDNNISLVEEGSTLTNTPIVVNADKFDRSISFTVKADKPGLHHYSITMPAADGEKNTTNNRKDIFVDVADKKKNILILCAAPHPDVNAIADAIKGLQNYSVTIKTIDNAPASFADYQVVILHQLPALHSTSLATLSLSKKPVWYILGSQSNISALNNDQKGFNIAPAPPHDILAGLHPAFNAFILPPNVQSVMDKMPPLVSPANDIQLGPAAMTLFEQKTGAHNIPVWAFIQGATPVAVLSGEGIWRWRLYEYKNFNSHEVIDECIRQTLSFLSANSNESPFRVEMPKFVWSDQESISLNAYLLNQNNEQINTPDAQIILTDSAGNKQSFSFERSGNAYRLNLGVRAGGTYTYAAKVNYNGTTHTANGSFVVESMPLELMETGADYPLLYGLAKKNNGALVPAANILSLYDSIRHNDNIKPVIQTSTESVPLIDRKWFFFLILIVATAEWLLRKYWLAQ